MGGLLNKPLPVFIHIPKTAGTAFRAVIEHNVEAAERVEIYRTGGISLARALWNERARLPAARIALGHFEHRVGEFIERECRYFTMLRDPVERVLSLYKFLKHDFKEHPLHRKFNSGDLDFDTWVNRRPRNASNVMTKMISGLATEYEDCTPNMLDRAIRNLRAMPAVGLQEHFNESVDRICAALGWKPIYPQRNRSGMQNRQFIESEEIGETTLQRIREINELDTALYQEAMSIFGLKASQAA